MVAGWATTVVSAAGRPVPPSHIPQAPDGVRQLILRFGDVVDHEHRHAFTADLARQLIEFAAETPPQDERLVVHCAAGVSRSPALAYAFLVALGQSPEGALREVMRVRPRGRPNPLVVTIADQELDGALWAPFEAWARLTNWFTVVDLAGLGYTERLAALAAVPRSDLL